MAKSMDIIDPKKEMEEEENSPAPPVLEEEKPKSGGTFYLVLGIVALIVATGSAVYILYKDYKPGQKKGAVATATATETPSVTATSSATATVTPPTNPTPSATAYKYTNESIRIANANGISGEAARIKKVLEEKGYKIASIGNASRKYETSIIYYKTGQEKLANALKEAVAGNYKATTENSDSIVGKYDAVVVLGPK